MSGVVRAQGAHHVFVHLPRGDTAIARVLGPALARIDPEAPAPQVLIVTPDAETAIAFARVARQDPRAPRMVPATGSQRASRLLRVSAPMAIAGPPGILLQLLGQSVLKLDGVRALILAWPEDIVASGGSDTLANLLADVPKDIVRALVASQATPETDALIERYLRRPTRDSVDGASAERIGAPIAYVTITPTVRIASLRRLLDELAPAQAVIAVQSPGVEAAVRELLDVLGYSDEGEIRVRSMDRLEASPVTILCELPDSVDALRPATAEPGAHLYALVQTREVDRLREMTSGAVTPLALEGPLARAHAADALLRGELRGVLYGAVPPRHVLTLAPLLDEFDGVEIAAAALHLMEQARRPGDFPTGAPASPAPTAEAWARVFMTVGSRDKVRPGDIVGAVLGETGITKTQIGKVEMDESHTLIEVAAALAEEVARKLNGTTIRGRRLVARLERDRPPRRSAPPRKGPGTRPTGRSR